MEAHGAVERTQAVARPSRGSKWLAALVPIAILGVAIAAFVALGAPGLERTGVPIEELAVERTVLTPGQIELTLRNDGPDPVAVRQVIVNDAFSAFTQTADQVGRLGADKVTIAYPWIEGENYTVTLLTETGATIDHVIEAATESPSTDAGFLGLMGLIGLYVGVIPVAIGMLWLPWVRRIDDRWLKAVMAFTVGLLGWLGVDAVLEGIEFSGAGPQAFGGAALVFLGAIVAYLVLAGVDAWLRGRQARLRAGRDRPASGGGKDGTSAGALASGGWELALLIAIGIGLHNLGEGLAIGSAYAIGALALGASLIVGFALHNTTEGLAIVAPVGEDRTGLRGRLPRLIALGVLAGAPAIVGAWIGASAFDASLAAFMFGLGAGAIIQVIVQLLPALRDRGGQLLNPVTVAGLLVGVAVMYLTGLLVSA